MLLDGGMKLTALALFAAAAAAAALPAPAAAQGYIEQKDNDAAGVIERAMAKIAEDPALFDGKVIPPGADLRQVGALAENLRKQLDVAMHHHNQLSAAGRARPAVQALMARWKQLAAYHQALVPVYNAAAAAQNDATKKQAAEDAAARERGLAACSAFRKELLADPTERERLDRLAQIDGGVMTFWQDTESGGKHAASLAKAAALCARPEFADIGRSCAYASHSRDTPEADWCAAAAKGNAVLQQGVRNLAAHHAKHADPGRSAEELASRDGWIDIEGPVTWNEYFSGKKQRDMIAKRLGPVFEQVGLTSIDDLEVFEKLEGHYAALAVRVKELAPTWDLPGAACSGAGCSAAKKTIVAWYPKAKVKKLLHKDSGWKIAKNGLGIPTHRYKSGFVLLQVAGDPLCQLRSWTVNETYAGAGRYEPATGAQIGYVRWQPCR